MESETTGVSGRAWYHAPCLALLYNHNETTAKRTPPQTKRLRKTANIEKRGEMVSPRLKLIFKRDHFLNSVKHHLNLPLKPSH